MRNTGAVGSVCRQIRKACEYIEGLSTELEMAGRTGTVLADTYSEISIDELKHVQMLTLLLTELITGIRQSAKADDGSVFYSGDLNYVKETGKDRGNGKENELERG